MPVTEDAFDPQEELSAWMERFLAETAADDTDCRSMRAQVWRDPRDAAAAILCTYVWGNWDLDEQSLARLWLVGRSLGAARDELITGYALQHAAPGRAVRPPDPPGDFVHVPILRGGGHGFGRHLSGKREFPRAWDDDEVIDRAMDVAKRPAGAVRLPAGTFRAFGEREGVCIGVVVGPDGELLTAYPVAGIDVVQHPLDADQEPEVRRLESLLGALPEREEPRISFDELMAVGEWPHVVQSLLVMDPPWTADQRAQLLHLATVTGVPVPDAPG